MIVSSHICIIPLNNSWTKMALKYAHIKVPVIVSSQRMWNVSSTFEPSSPEGAVGSSGAAPGKHWLIGCCCSYFLDFNWTIFPYQFLFISLMNNCSTQPEACWRSVGLPFSLCPRHKLPMDWWQRSVSRNDTGRCVWSGTIFHFCFVFFKWFPGQYLPRCFV